MKYFIYIIILLFIVSCKEKNQFLIEGNIKNLNADTLYVTTHQAFSNHLQTDTIYSQKGKFSYQGQADSLSAVIIYMKQGTVWTTVWAKDKDKITLTGDVRYPELILARGGEVNDLLTSFKEQNKDLLKESRELADQKQEINQIDSLGVRINNIQLESKLSNLNHQLKENAEDFIKEHPTSLASLVLLEDYVIDYDDPDGLEQYLSLLHGNAVHFPLYHELNELSNKLKQTKIGVTAPDFQLKDINQNTVKLNDFKGKYLLLNFTASWCKACEENNNELPAIRKKYKDDKLEMLTISLDSSTNDWKKVVVEKGYSWRQVVDTLIWDSQIASLYNITAIPFNLLLDENNVIIAKDLSPDSLMFLLEETEK